MALSSELITKLVKVTNDRGRDSRDYTVYGTVTTDGSRNYVKMDGSDLSTPIETTVEINEGDRVIVEVKNHTATVTGNTTNPSIGTVTADNLRSSITQTASEIRTEVADELNGLSSRITQNADSITTVVNRQDEFSQFQQTVEGFSFMNKGGTVKISGGDINLTGAIKFSDLSDSDDVQDQIDTANSNASDAVDTADGVLTTVNGITITEGSKTYIDGEMLYTGSVYADAIHLGGALTVYKTLYGNTAGGTLGYDSGFNSDSGIGIRASDDNAQVVCTNKAARLSYSVDNQVVTSASSVSLNGTAINVNSSGGVYIGSEESIEITNDVGHIDLTNAYLELNGPEFIRFQIGSVSYLRFVEDGNMLFGPYLGKVVDLGSSTTPWNNAYTETGTIQTSDRNKKNSIEDLPTKYLTLFDGLRPRIFKMNDGTSDRYHVGYIAQEVEEAMSAAGIESQEFAGFIRDKDEEGNDILMLRYGEFDAIYSAKIKQLESRIEKLEKLLTENT